MLKIYKTPYVLFWSFIFIMIVSACSKKNDIAATVKETSIFTYTMNGVDTKTDSCTYIWYKETNNFSFSAYANGYPKFEGNISVPLITGTYQIVSNSANLSFFPTISIVGYAVVGTLTITSIDATNKIITGTFTGSCTHNNTTDVFTNGKFTARSKY